MRFLSPYAKMEQVGSCAFEEPPSDATDTPQAQANYHPTLRGEEDGYRMPLPGGTHDFFAVSVLHIRTSCFWKWRTQSFVSWFRFPLVGHFQAGPGLRSRVLIVFVHGAMPVVFEITAGKGFLSACAILTLLYPPGEGL